MSRHVIVTGAAGFIGSSTCSALLDSGWSVTGIDAFTGNYARALKANNVQAMAARSRFRFIEADIGTMDLAAVLEGADRVIHLAGEPGVRPSWGDSFDRYVSRNVASTQRLLEAACDASVARVGHALSSSIYGAAEAYPTSETALPKPISPYGVTKLAGEHLCSLYGHVRGLSTVSLRYFTVFGPRQRPDMAIERLIHCALSGDPFPLNGDGSARRDFTFIDDVVQANCRALEADVPPGIVVNIGGGEQGVELREVVARVGELAGAPVLIQAAPAAPGDPPRTGADIDRAGRLLGWAPRTPFWDGLARHVQFAKERFAHGLRSGVPSR